MLAPLIFLAIAALEPPTVTLQVAGEHSDRLQAALQERLLEEGYRLVPRSEVAGAELSISTSSAAVDIAVIGRQSIAQRVSLERSLDSVTLLELQHRVLLAIERAELRVLEPLPAPPIAAPLPPAQDNLQFDASLSAGPLVASGGGLSLVSELGLGRRLGGSLLLLFTPSAVGGEGLVIETIVALGPRYRFALHDRFDLVLGAALGARLHTFRIEEAGTRVDWAALGKLQLDYNAGDRWAFFGGALFGLTGSERSHVLDGAEIWRREAWLVSGLIGLRWRGSI